MSAVLTMGLSWGAHCSAVLEMFWILLLLYCCKDVLFYTSLVPIFLATNRTYGSAGLYHASIPEEERGCNGDIALPATQLSLQVFDTQAAVPAYSAWPVGAKAAAENVQHSPQARSLYPPVRSGPVQSGPTNASLPPSPPPPSPPFPSPTLPFPPPPGPDLVFACMVVLVGRIYIYTWCLFLFGFSAGLVFVVCSCVCLCVFFCYGWLLFSVFSVRVHRR